MAVLAKLNKMVVRVNGDDHVPPHFHIIAADFEVLVRIADLGVERGILPAKAAKVVMPWIEANRPLIVAEWNRLNPRFPTV
jgi:hypothetical protein